MVKLPQMGDLDLEGKRVLVRGDLDVDPGKSNEIYRLEALLPTLKYLFEKGCEITLIGHRGRPEGKVVPALSLKPVEGKLRQIGPGVSFTMLENLRFNPGESFDHAQDAGAGEFAKKLAENQDVFINESFAESHREVASIVGLPKLLPHAAGFRFIQEVENLSKVLENPKRPLVVIIGGVKEDKLVYIEPLAKLADKVLVGGRLPEYIEKMQMLKNQMLNGRLQVAKLNPDKEDITIHSIEKFEREIAKAGTIVLAGPLGKYEEEGHRQGTERVFKAVTDNKEALKIAGGGDTIAAINGLRITSDFSWISVGGGAMLEYLAKGTLPGIEALLDR